MVGKIEEIKLLAQCMAADNREAFSRLVVMHQEPLRRFLVNLCRGDAALADDLAQETFVKAWLAVRSFRVMSGFRTWLFRIAINEYLSDRRRCHEQRLTAEQSDAAERVAEDADCHTATERRMDVAALLDRLSEPERVVTLLFYLQDLPMKEIVKVTGMPMGTVKSHLSRARVHLAQISRQL